MTLKVIIFPVSCSKLVQTSSSVFIKESFLLQLFGNYSDSTQIVIRVRYQLHVFQTQGYTMNATQKEAPKAHKRRISTWYIVKHTSFSSSTHALSPRYITL